MHARILSSSYADLSPTWRAAPFAALGSVIALGPPCVFAAQAVLKVKRTRVSEICRHLGPRHVHVVSVPCMPPCWALSLTRKSSTQAALWLADLKVPNLREFHAGASSCPSPGLTHSAATSNTTRTHAIPPRVTQHTLLIEALTYALRLQAVLIR
jgi:hypothetical protein